MKQYPVRPWVCISAPCGQTWHYIANKLAPAEGVIVLSSSCSQCTQLHVGFFLLVIYSFYKLNVEFLFYLLWVAVA